MSANKIPEIERKRSRPVEKRSIFKRYPILIPFLSLIIVIIFVVSVIFVFGILEPEKEIDANDDNENGGGTTTGNPIAIIDTSMGTIKAEIYEDKVPITAGNFIDHANDGYYDGVIFHRVITDFMIQGGDPLGTGTGGHAARYHEGYGDEDYPDTWVIPDEFHDDLKHDSAGILSMANAGANTGGSQFFITVKATSWLDGAHAVFGKVTEGLDVVVEISELDPDQTDANNKPYEDVIINSITIER